MAKRLARQVNVNIPCRGKLFSKNNRLRMSVTNYEICLSIDDNDGVAYLDIEKAKRLKKWLARGIDEVEKRRAAMYDRRELTH